VKNTTFKEPKDRNGKKRSWKFIQNKQKNTENPDKPIKQEKVCKKEEYPSC